MYPAEKMIRDMAEKNPNSYHISFFACCRQNYKPEKCIPRPYEAATELPIDKRADFDLIIDQETTLAEKGDDNKVFETRGPA